MRPSRSVVFGTTVGVWLVLCGLSLYGLILSARHAGPGMIEEYARTPSFQVLNFAVGLLPGLILVLAVVLAVEWLLFRVLQKPHLGRP
jgi:hypothetical protein